MTSPVVPEKPRKTRRVDYRTLTVIGFVLLALTGFLVVLDDAAAKRDYRLQIAHRDAALSAAQDQATKALEQSQVNGGQLNELLRQFHEQARLIEALRGQVLRAGLVPVSPAALTYPTPTRPAPMGAALAPSGSTPVGRTSVSSAPAPSPRPTPAPSPSPTPSPSKKTCILTICLG